MTIKRLATRRIQLGREQPPSEFLLWAFGTIDTVKGRFPLTRADGESVMASLVDVGNRIPFFYKHLRVDENGEIVDPYEERRSAGSALAELRSDGLWIVDIRWTDPGAEQISEREWLYVSPEFGVDKTTKAIAELYAIALTNTPATKHAPQLVAASREGQPMTDEEKEAAALAAAPPTDGDGGGDAAAPDEAEAKRSAAVERHHKAMEELAASHAACRALGIAGYEGSPYDAPKTTEPVADGMAPPVADPPPARETEARAMSKTTTALAAHAGNKSAEVISLSRRLDEMERKERMRDAEMERKERTRDAQSKVDEAVRAGHVTPAERSELVALGTRDGTALDGMLKIFAGRGPATAARVVDTNAGAAANAAAAATIAANGGAGKRTLGVPVVLSREGKAPQTVMLDPIAVQTGMAAGLTLEQLAASQLKMGAVLGRGTFGDPADAEEGA